MTADHTTTADTDTTALIKQILTAAIAAPEQVGPALGDAFARFLNGERARVLREAADGLRTFAADTYPEDIFRKPSDEDYREINALLSRERGHMLDGVAADCYRRALAIGARELDALADETEETDRDR